MLVYSEARRCWRSAFLALLAFDPRQTLWCSVQCLHHDRSRSQVAWLLVDRLEDRYRPNMMANSPSLPRDHRPKNRPRLSRLVARPLLLHQRLLLELHGVDDDMYALLWYIAAEAHLAVFSRQAGPSTCPSAIHLQAQAMLERTKDNDGVRKLPCGQSVFNNGIVRMRKRPIRVQDSCVACACSLSYLIRAHLAPKARTTKILIRTTVTMDSNGRF